MLSAAECPIEASERSAEHLSPGTHVCMGIDEAGRGPVLGPMVYAGFVCPTPYDAGGALRRTGVADSKALSAARREELFATAQGDPHTAWFVRVLSPELLSRCMLRGSRINLNAISHNAAASLVRAATDAAGLIVDRLCVDTVGDPAFYRRFLQAQCPGVGDIVVAPRADATYATVSAASIVAKVTRDERMRNWRFRERNADFSRRFGSGYPGDPETKAWLRATLDPVFGFPSVIRFSWQTTKKLLEQAAVPVAWEDDGDDNNDDGSSLGEPAAKQTKLSFGSAATADRYRYFSECSLESVTAAL